MFRDREDAALQLAKRFIDRAMYDPIVLAIPRGGVVTGAVLARELGAELDVVLSRKLRAPGQPELAIGAICEMGEVYLNHLSQDFVEQLGDHLEGEKRHQLAEIARRQVLFRSVRPPAAIKGRTAIVTDDGVATGATMIAALQSLRPKQPRELIVAVPVASPDRLAEVRQYCDEVVCLHATTQFWAVGQFYEDFEQVTDDEAVELLRRSTNKAEVA